MTKPWPAALANMCRLARIGTIVHIGAGEGKELQGYLATGAHRVVLVEPNPELLPDLERAAAGDERIRVLAVAVSAKAGRAPLHLFNFRALSSLRPASGLQELFPGLRTTEEAEVETQRLTDVLHQADIDATATNVLVIDAPGEEHRIVTDLFGSAWATQFSRIVLHAAAAPIHDGAAPVSELVDLLEEHGYRVTGETDDDPDRPEIFLRFDPLVVENGRLAEESAGVAERARALETELSQTVNALQDTRRRLQETETAFAALEQERSELAAELERQRGSRQQERKKLSTKAGRPRVAQADH